MNVDDVATATDPDTTSAPDPQAAAPDDVVKTDDGAQTLMASASAPTDDGKADPQATSTDAAGDGTDGQADDNTDDDKKPEGAPDEYAEFTMPEGTELDEEVGTAFKDVAKELNLSQEKAQGMLDKIAPVMQKRSIEKIQQISNEWSERSKVDPEFGGKNLETSLSHVARLRDQFARNADGKIDPDIQEFMNSPMGNHPGTLKFLSRIGKAFGEANYPTGNPASGPYTAEQFYQDAMRGGK